MLTRHGTAVQPKRARPDGARDEHASVRFVRRLDPVRGAALASGSIATLAVLGVVHALGREGGPGVRLVGFGLDAEWSIPALFSGALLFGAAGASLAAARAGALHHVGPRALLFLAAFFAFMGLDDVLQIHENLEQATGTGWQRLYLPLMAAGGVAWLLALRGLWGYRLARMCFMGGAGAWVVAQLFERVQRDGERLVHRWTILPEEVLEMTGSALFALALVLAVQAALRVRASGPPSVGSH